MRISYPRLVPAGGRAEYPEIEYDDSADIAEHLDLANDADTGLYNDATTFEATLQSSRVITHGAD